MEKEYNKLKEKYKLPDFEVIDREFRVSDSESVKYPLTNIRERIIEKTDEFLKILEAILQPDTSLSDIYEYKSFDDPERNEIYKVYKRLMNIHRHSLKVSVNEHEEDNAVFINLFFKDWEATKKELVKIINSLMESWEIETNIKEDLSYLG